MARSSTFGTPEFGMDRRMAVGTVRDSRSERILFPRRPGVRDWSGALCLAEQHPGSGRGREITAQHSSVLDFRDTVSDTVCEPTGDKVSAGSVCGNRRPRKRTRDMMRPQKRELLVYGSDDEIRSHEPYGHALYPPKG